MSEVIISSDPESPKFFFNQKSLKQQQDLVNGINKRSALYNRLPADVKAKLKAEVEQNIANNGRTKRVINIRQEVKPLPQPSMGFEAEKTKPSANQGEAKKVSSDGKMKPLIAPAWDF